MLSAKEARQKLIDGNQAYIEARTGQGDISPEIRLQTAHFSMKTG